MAGRFTGFSLRRTGLGAFLLLALLLLIVYGAGWYVVHATRVSQETELEQHLKRVGQLALPELGDDALALADLALDLRWLAGPDTGQDAPSQGPSPYRASYASQLLPSRLDDLDAFAQRAGLARLVVLTPDATVLYDSAAPQDLLVPFDYSEIDAFELRRAAQGQPTASLAYRRGDQSYKRLYLPVVDAIDDEDSEPRAILVLVANRDYLQTIDLLAKRLRRHALQLTILTLLIGLLIWRLIRRQRSIERQAAEADRLAALGALSAGFAHELRNPLGIIRAFAEDLEHSTRNAPAATDQHAQVEEACHAIVEEIDRMDRLVAQFLEHSRPGAAALRGGPRAGAEPSVVGRELTSVLAMLRPSAQKRNVTLALEATPAAEGHAPVPMEPGAFRQVLMNLVLNALEAAPEKSTVRVHVDVADGELRLRVTDEGPGIAERDRSRIFEPFFTTRSNGSGLGLTVSRRLVSDAGGSLALEKKRSAPGASFLVRLPVRSTRDESSRPKKES